jgi:hypothetical protein
MTLDANITPEQRLLRELRLLEQRAEALSSLGEAVRNGTRSEEHAKAEYKSLKEDLAERLKQHQRGRSSTAVEVWVSTSFEAALRIAHIAMRTPTNTSPRNSSWANSVYDVASELAYHASSLNKGLSTDPD